MEEKWYVPWWREFHTCLTPDQAWLDRMIGKIDCWNCKMGFLGIIRANPPDFSKKGFFAWTVAVHNSVTLKMSPSAVPTTIQQAKAIWGIAE